MSVALCTCNGKAYLREQLDSIALQSRPIDELIVCDDASTDDTLDVVRAFQQSKNLPFEVQLVVNPARLGVTQNFAQAVGACTGEFIFLADQDDVWASQKVEKLLALLQADSACAAAFCDAEVCDGTLKPMGHGLFEAVWFTQAEQQMVQQGRAIEAFARHAIAAGTTLAFRRAFVDLLLPIPDLRNAHDIWISTMLACVAPVAFTNDRLVKYRVHGHNQVGMRSWNLSEQIGKAREQLQTAAFAHAAQLYGSMVERLRDPRVSDRFPARAGALKRLDEKVDHSRRRDTMRGGVLGFPSRCATVLLEGLRGRYGRYSYGLKSVLQDLFLR